MPASSPSSDRSRRARFDGRRVAALAATLSVHLALLLLLLRGTAFPPPPAGPPAPLIVRMAVLTRPAAAGLARTDPRASRAAVPQPLRTRRREAVAARRPEPAIVVAEPVPPPPLAPIRLATSAPAVSPADGIDAAAAGAGHRGAATAGAGSSVFSTRISFRRAARPVLSSHARVMGLTGYAILLVRVGIDGRPLDVRIARSSGHPDLDSAAVRAARASDFNPHRRDGQPIEFIGIVPYTFGVAEPPVARDLARLGIVATG